MTLKPIMVLALLASTSLAGTALAQTAPAPTEPAATEPATTDPAAPAQPDASAAPSDGGIGAVTITPAAPGE